MRKSTSLLVGSLFMAMILLCGNSSFGQDRRQQYTIRRGNVAYDFTFAELAVLYLETGDAAYLQRIAESKAAEHILNHARRYNYDVPKGSSLELVKHLLSPSEEKRKLLPDFKRNLQYAKRHVAEIDLPQGVCLQYLPGGFHYASSLFFTFGYDLGVAYGNNASVNLAHPYYLKNMNEIRYYSIHELHHAGFVLLKKNVMPSLGITRYEEMSRIIEYLAHLEGMATYAALGIRQKENAMNIDKDYLAMQDPSLMKEYEKELIDIYFHFKKNPGNTLTDKDWDMLSVLTNKKRLLYRVGASMAMTIDHDMGREKLVSLIVEPSENFFTTYLMIKKNDASVH